MYPKSHVRGRNVKPRVDWRGNPDAQAQCDRCSDWVQHSSIKEQLEFRGGTAPVGTGIWVCGRCYDVPNPQGALNVEVLKQDPIPVINARPDTTTYDLTILSFATGNLPDPTEAPYVGYQIYVTGIAVDPVLCYSDGPTWRNFYTEAVVT